MQIINNNMKETLIPLTVLAISTGCNFNIFEWLHPFFISFLVLAVCRFLFT